MEGMIETLLVFTLVITRVSAFFLVLPVFGSQVIPVRVKLATIIIISVILLVNFPQSNLSPETKPLEALILLFNEASYGLCLGLICALVFSAVRLCGRFIERQMGMAMAEIMDPLNGEGGQPLSMLLEMIFIIMFLSANGHHMFLLIISKSCQALPFGTYADINTMTGAVIEAGSTMFLACLRLSAPMLAAFIVLMIALAILARITPDMNILFISMPLRVGLGLLMMAIFIPFMNSFVSEFSEWMYKLLPL